MSLEQILVVDDQPEVLQLFARMLSTAREGYLVLRADNGQRALSLLRERQPDVMLLDLVMPGMDGFQLLKEKEQDASIRDIPVVIVSGNPRGADEFWGKKIGAADFMQKPYSRGELYQRVENLLYGNSVKLD